MSRSVAEWLAANPFPGLRSFRPEEADRFFGRRQQIDELERLLERRRLVAVAGASGSGKSSLVLAGLLHALAGRKAGSGVEWRFAVMRPGGRPIANLAAALAQALEDSPAEPQTHEQRVETLYGQLRVGGRGLVEMVRRTDASEEAPLLLVVDQFEEVFRFRQTGDAAADPDHAAAFVKLLLQAAADPDAPLRIVLTLRSDTLGSCAEFRDLPEAVSRGQYLIPRLKRAQRKEAIVRPIEWRGATIAPRLVQRLLNDVSEDYDDLPVMQHVLARTWARWAVASRGSRPLDIEDYEAVGGAALALSQHADEAADEAGRELGGPTRAVERVFRALTERLAAGTEVRRPLAFDALVAVCGGDLRGVSAVVERFRRADTAFLMPGAEVALAANPVIDISHESLIRQWQRLRGWVAAEAAARAELMRLVGEAERRDTSDGNLWRGRNLERALEWQSATQPNAAWVALCTGGDGEAQWASAAKFLADSAAAVRHEQQRERTRRWSLRVLVALVVLVSVGAAWNNMIKQRQSRAGELSNQALLELTRDPARSAHLAALALEHDAANSGAENLLRQAMASLEVARAEQIVEIGAPVADLQFSADRKTAVVAAGHEVRVYDTSRWQSVGAPIRLDSAVEQVFLAGAGRWIVVRSASGAPRAYPVGGGAPVTLGCEGAADGGHLIALSAPDAEHAEAVAVVCDSGEIVSARIGASGVSAKLLHDSGQARRQRPEAIAFNGDGRYLAAGDATGEVTIWKTDHAGAWIAPAADGHSPIRHRAGAVLDLSFHPADDRLLVTASDDGTAVVWTLDLPQRRLALPAEFETVKIVLPHRAPVQLARFAQRAYDDDYRLLSVAGKLVYFWSDETHRDIRPHDDTVVDVAVSDDGEMLASASVDGTVQLWSTRAGSRIAVLAGHRGEVSRVRFGPGGRVVTASSDGTVRVWKVDPPAMLAAQGGAIKGAAFDRDSRHVIVCGEPLQRSSRAGSETIACRIVAPTPLASRRDAEVARLAQPADAGVAGRASPSADGGWIAVGMGNGKPPRLWSPSRQAAEPVPGAAPLAAAFARAAPVLATLESDGAVVLWDAKSLGARAVERARFAARPGRAVLAISPDGRWVAVNEFRRVLLLDAQAPNAAPRLLHTHQGELRSLAFQPDGSHLVSASADRDAVVLAIDQRQPAVVLAGGVSGRRGLAIGGAPSHTAGVNSAAFSADGRLVATGSADHSIRIWDAASGRELAATARHREAVTAVDFAPDGRILSASDDGTVMLGRCTSCTLPLAELRRRVAAEIRLPRADVLAFDAMPRPWLVLPRW